MLRVQFSKKATQAISAFVLLATFGATVPAHASGVPVFDGANVAQAIAQVQNQVRQIESMRQQIKAITDNGNYAELLNNPELRKHLNRYLPKGYTDIVQAVQKGDAGAIQAVYEQVQRAEAQKRSSMTGLERVKVTQAANEAQMIARLKGLDVHEQAVTSLVNQINRTQNTAQKQDLMNSLQAQQAMIQVELGRIQILLQMSERQDRMAEKQVNDEFKQKMLRRP